MGSKPGYWCECHAMRKDIPDEEVIGCHTKTHILECVKQWLGGHNPREWELVDFRVTFSDGEVRFLRVRQMPKAYNIEDVTLEMQK